MDQNEHREKDSIIRFEPFLLFLVFYLPGYLLQSQDFSGRRFDSVFFNLSYLLEALPRMALLLYIVVIRSRISDQGDSSKMVLHRLGFGPFRSASIAWSLLLVVIIEIVIVPISILGGMIADHSHGVIAREIQWRLSNPAILPLVFLTCMVTGYSEELFFRSYLLTTIPRMGFGIPTAVAASTALFALGHIYEGVAAIAGTAAIGLILSFVFLRKRDIHMIAIAHGLYNFVTLVATLAGARGAL